MRNNNITKWADALSATDSKQARGALCEVRGNGTVGYCCLGFGSTFVPGIKIVMPEVPDDAWLVKKALFGEIAADGLAPPEFMTWLGYDMNDNERAQYDVFFDFPEDLRLRSYEDTEASESGGDSAFDKEAERLVGLSAADANDSGFTFAQIADIIHYFGLRDEVGVPRA